jgi:putative DNA primase/helicase
MLARVAVLSWPALMGAIDQFCAALRERQIIPPANIVADGKIHRCDAEGRNGRGDAAYLLHLDGLVAGGFQNWRDGRGWENWRPDLDRKLSHAEEQLFRARLEALRQQREKEDAARLIETKDRARVIWRASKPVAGVHQYLAGKGVNANGTRVCAETAPVGGMDCAGSLVIPLHDASGELCQLQLIAPNGEKRFLPGPKPPGLYFSIGKPGAAICIAEGFATAASIHQATGHAVAVAFDCGNLAHVATVLRGKFPATKIILCADDDRRTDGNPGITKATAAALVIGAYLAVPDFGPDRPDNLTDFNDLYRMHGPEAVNRCITNAAMPPKAPGNDVKQTSHAITRRMSNVIARPVKWLWPGRIACGKVTVLAGHPGLGKSQVTVNFAATVTTGGQWADGSYCDKGSVLVVSGEDDAADTIKPRLEAAGADLCRVHILDAIQETASNGQRLHRGFNLKSDLADLESLLATLGDVRMLVIDPITAYLGDTDSYKNADVRALLAPIADLAARFDVAIIGVSHLSKAGSQKALLRVSGSLAFVAAARAAYLVADDPEQEGRRLLLPLKNNIGPDKTGFGFSIESKRLRDGIDTSRVVWDSSPVSKTADEVLSAEDSRGDARRIMVAAKEFLCEMLADGPVDSTTIYMQADAEGHSKRTIDRAKRDLGIRSDKTSMNGGWRWELPPKDANQVEHCHAKVMATFDDFGNLRANNTGVPPDSEVI